MSLADSQKKSSARLPSEGK